MVVEGGAEDEGADGFDDLGDGLVNGEGFEDVVHAVGGHEGATSESQREDDDEGEPLDGFDGFGVYADDGRQPGECQREQQDEADDGKPAEEIGVGAKADDQAGDDHDDHRDQVAEQVGDDVAGEDGEIVHG